MNSDGVLLLRRPRFQQNVTEPQTKRTRSQPFRKQSTISSLPKLHSTTRLQAIRVKRSYLPNSCKIQTADDDNMQNMFLTQLPSKISSQFCLVSKELIVSDNCENRTNFYRGNETNGNRKAWRKEPIRPVQLEPDLPYLDQRAPLYQSLIEVTREIKVALVKSHGVNIRCAIHQMPKYDPSVPLKSGPRHEIVIVESGDADSGDYGSELLGKTTTEQYRSSAFMHQMTPMFKRTHCTSIDVLPQQVKLLDALQTGGRSIDLTACRLRGLPNPVAFHHTLVHLDLSWNFLTELPGSLENMTRMEILTLRSNPLRHVPLSVTKLRCLRQLDLSHCLLSDLPYDLYKLKDLERLDVSYNMIEKLDGKINGLRELREFNATGNDLLGVPPGLLNLVVKKLDRLRLEHNPLLIPFPGEFVDGYYQHTDSPQTLRHMALGKLRTESRLRLTAKTNPFEVGRDGQNDNSSRGWHYWTNVYFLTQRFRSGSCCWCGRARFGQGISVCRHCVNISNYKQVPIMFNCCGPGCAHEAAQCSANEFETRFYANHSVTATELAKQ